MNQHKGNIDASHSKWIFPLWPVSISLVQQVLKCILSWGKNSIAREQNIHIKFSVKFNFRKCFWKVHKKEVNNKKNSNKWITNKRSCQRKIRTGYVLAKKIKFSNDMKPPPLNISFMSFHKNTNSYIAYLNKLTIYHHIPEIRWRVWSLPAHIFPDLWFKSWELSIGIS